MINAESIYTTGLIFVEQLCLYATLIPKKIWGKVGKLDQNLQRRI